MTPDVNTIVNYRVGGVSYKARVERVWQVDTGLMQLEVTGLDVGNHPIVPRVADGRALTDGTWRELGGSQS